MGRGGVEECGGVGALASAAIGVSLMVGAGACSLANPTYTSGSSTATNSTTTDSSSAASDGNETFVISAGAGSAPVTSGATDGQTTGAVTTGAVTTGAVTTTTGAVTTGAVTTGVVTTTGMATTGMATEGSSVAFCGDGGQEAAEQALAANQCEELIVMEQKIFACLMAQPWEDAKEVCEKLCGRLVIAKSENKRLALHGFLHENLVEPETDPDKEHQSEYPTASVWVGASNKEDPWTPFYWVDATEMPSMKGMDGWGKNDPNVNDFAGVVLAIFGPGQYDDGIWFDREGVLSYIFVCESEDAPTG